MRQEYEYIQTLFLPILLENKEIGNGERLLERIIYEIRPFLYLYGAFTGRLINSSTFTTVMSMLLTACAFMILYWRWHNSRAANPMRTKR